MADQPTKRYFQSYLLRLVICVDHPFPTRLPIFSSVEFEYHAILSAAERGVITVYFCVFQKRLACIRFQHYSIKVTHIDALLYYFCGSYHSAPVSNLPNYQIRSVLIFYVLE